MTITGEDLRLAYERGVQDGGRIAQDEIVRLREVAATCYAGLGGECDLPEAWLDALSAAAEGRPFDSSHLCRLPVSEPQSPADAVSK